MQISWIQELEVLQLAELVLARRMREELGQRQLVQGQLVQVQQPVQLKDWQHQLQMADSP